MEALNQIMFIDGVFDLLIKCGLAVKDKDYFNKQGVRVWENKVHDTVSEACLDILNSIS